LNHGVFVEQGDMQVIRAAHMPLGAETQQAKNAFREPVVQLPTALGA
jgi:hypothetical protein